MATFRVKIATPEGGIAYREFEASTREALASRLEKEGLLPIAISAKGALSSLLGALSRSGVASGDLLVFNQGLSALLKAGVTVPSALKVLKESEPNPVLSEAINEVMEGVKGGRSLSEAFTARPDVFSPLFASAIGAGERTGDLIPSIKGYVAYLKSVEAIRKKVVTAATYPVILAAASVLVIGFLISYVVPSFSKIYMDAGAELPIATRALLGLTGFVRSYFLFLVFIAVVSVIALKYYLKTPAGRRFLDGLKLKLPVLGHIYLSYSAAKFSRTLGMVLKSGVPVVPALRMAGGVLGNEVLKERLLVAADKAAGGEGVTAAIEEAGLFPAVSLKMFGVGERTASLPSVLEDIAEFNESEVDHRVSVLTGMLEPALMIIMGLVIGAIVILMYLPIFQLGARM